MTTERSGIGKALARLVTAVPVVLSLWLGVLVTTALLQPAGQPVAVFAAGGPEAALAAVIAADGSILEIRTHAVVAISGDPSFVRRLYREGGVIVVGARRAGCGLGAGFTRTGRTVA
jgi:hypothetical protein